MKIFSLIGLVVILSGCSAKPNFFNGRYYMGGDSSCVRGRVISDTRMMCINSDGEETGYRDAMTDQQLQMYRNNNQSSKTTKTRCRTTLGTTRCTTY